MPKSTSRNPRWTSSCSIRSDNASDARLLREMFQDEGPRDTRLIHVERMSDAEKYLAESPVDIVLLDQIGQRQRRPLAARDVSGRGPARYQVDPCGAHERCRKVPRGIPGGPRPARSDRTTPATPACCARCFRTRARAIPG